MAENKKINIDVEVGVKGGEDLKNVKGSLEDIADNTKKIGDNGKKAQGGLDSVKKGFNGIGTAIKATGLGLVIGLFASLKEILSQQQPVLDAVDTAFTAIGLAIKAVTEAIGSAFEANSKANGGFDATIKVIKNLMTIAINPFKLAIQAISGIILTAQLAWEKSFFGEGNIDRIKELEDGLKRVGENMVEIGKSTLNAGIEVAKNIGEAVQEVGSFVADAAENISNIDAQAIINQAKRTTELKKQAEIAKAINEGLIAQYDRLAEKQRQLRDDDTKAITDRIAANEELAKVLDKQETAMLKNANAQVAAAQAEYAANQTTENRVKLIEAQNEKASILADIEGKRSEQLQNQISLQHELDALTQTQIDGDAARAQQQKEFDVEQEEDTLRKLELKKQLLAEEQQIELDRLQAIIDSTTAGTQARVDAEQEYLNKKQEFAQQEVEIEKQKTAEIQAQDEALKASKFALVSAVSTAVGALGSLFKQNSAAAKAAALTQIAIDSAVGFIQGLDIAQKSAKATGPAAAFAFPIFYATQVGAILTAIGKAKAILGAGGGGGSAPAAPAAPPVGGVTGQGGGGTTVEQPTLQRVRTQGTDNTVDGSGTVVKAFVVSSDISKQQDKDAIIERRASF